MSLHSLLAFALLFHAALCSGSYLPVPSCALPRVGIPERCSVSTFSTAYASFVLVSHNSATVGRVNERDVLYGVDTMFPDPPYVAMRPLVTGYRIGIIGITDAVAFALVVRVPNPPNSTLYSISMLQPELHVSGGHPRTTSLIHSLGVGFKLRFGSFSAVRPTWHFLAAGTMYGESLAQVGTICSARAASVGLDPTPCYPTTATPNTAPPASVGGSGSRGRGAAGQGERGVGDGRERSTRRGAVAAETSGWSSATHCTPDVRALAAAPRFAPLDAMRNGTYDWRYGASVSSHLPPPSGEGDDVENGGESEGGGGGDGARRRRHGAGAQHGASGRGSRRAANPFVRGARDAEPWLSGGESDRTPYVPAAGAVADPWPCVPGTSPPISRANTTTTDSSSSSTYTPLQQRSGCAAARGRRLGAPLTPASYELVYTVDGERSATAPTHGRTRYLYTTDTSAVVAYVYAMYHGLPPQPLYSPYVATLLDAMLTAGANRFQAVGAARRSGYSYRAPFGPGVDGTQVASFEVDGVVIGASAWAADLSAAWSRWPLDGALRAVPAAGDGDVAFTPHGYAARTGGGVRGDFTTAGSTGGAADDGAAGAGSGDGGGASASAGAAGPSGVATSQSAGDGSSTGVVGSATLRMSHAKERVRTASVSARTPTASAPPTHRAATAAASAFADGRLMASSTAASRVTASEVFANPIPTSRTRLRPGSSSRLGVTLWQTAPSAHRRALICNVVVCRHGLPSVVDVPRRSWMYTSASAGDVVAWPPVVDVGIFGTQCFTVSASSCGEMWQVDQWTATASDALLFVVRQETSPLCGTVAGTVSLWRWGPDAPAKARAVVEEKESSPAQGGGGGGGGGGAGGGGDSFSSAHRRATSTSTSTRVHLARPQWQPSIPLPQLRFASSTTPPLPRPPPLASPFGRVRAAYAPHSAASRSQSPSPHTLLATHPTPLPHLRNNTQHSAFSQVVILSSHSSSSVRDPPAPSFPIPRTSLFSSRATTLTTSRVRVGVTAQIPVPSPFRSEAPNDFDTKAPTPSFAPHGGPADPSSGSYPWSPRAVVTSSDADRTKGGPPQPVFPFLRVPTEVPMSDEGTRGWGTVSPSVSPLWEVAGTGACLMQSQISGTDFEDSLFARASCSVAIPDSFGCPGLRLVHAQALATRGAGSLRIFKQTLTHPVIAAAHDGSGVEGGEGGTAGGGDSGATGSRSSNVRSVIPPAWQVDSPTYIVAYSPLRVFVVTDSEPPSRVTLPFEKEGGLFEEDGGAATGGGTGGGTSAPSPSASGNASAEGSIPPAASAGSVPRIEALQSSDVVAVVGGALMIITDKGTLMTSFVRDLTTHPMVLRWKHPVAAQVDEDGQLALSMAPVHLPTLSVMHVAPRTAAAYTHSWLASVGHLDGIRPVLATGCSVAELLGGDANAVCEKRHLEDGAVVVPTALVATATSHGYSQSRMPSRSHEMVMMGASDVLIDPTAAVARWAADNMKRRGVVLRTDDQSEGALHGVEDIEARLGGIGVDRRAFGAATQPYGTATHPYPNRGRNASGSALLDYWSAVGPAWVGLDNVAASPLHNPLAIVPVPVGYGGDIWPIMGDLWSWGVAAPRAVLMPVVSPLCTPTPGLLSPAVVAMSDEDAGVGGGVGGSLPHPTPAAAQLRGERVSMRAQACAASAVVAVTSHLAALVVGNALIVMRPAAFLPYAPFGIRPSTSTSTSGDGGGGGGAVGGGSVSSSFPPFSPAMLEGGWGGAPRSSSSTVDDVPAIPSAPSQHAAMFGVATTAVVSVAVWLTSAETESYARVAGVSQASASLASFLAKPDTTRPPTAPSNQTFGASSTAAAGLAGGGSGSTSPPAAQFVLTSAAGSLSLTERAPRFVQSAATATVIPIARPDPCHVTAASSPSSSQTSLSVCPTSMSWWALATDGLLHRLRVPAAVPRASAASLLIPALSAPFAGEQASLSHLLWGSGARSVGRSAFTSSNTAPHGASVFSAASTAASTTASPAASTGMSVTADDSAPAANPYTVGGLVDVASVVNRTAGVAEVGGAFGEKDERILYTTQWSGVANSFDVYTSPSAPQGTGYFETRPVTWGLQPATSMPSAFRHGLVQVDDVVELATPSDSTAQVTYLPVALPFAAAQAAAENGDAWSRPLEAMGDQGECLIPRMRRYMVPLTLGASVEATVEGVSVVASGARSAVSTARGGEVASVPGVDINAGVDFQVGGDLVTFEGDPPSSQTDDHADATPPRARTAGQADDAESGSALRQASAFSPSSGAGEGTSSTTDFTHRFTSSPPPSVVGGAFTAMTFDSSIAAVDAAVPIVSTVPFSSPPEPSVFDGSAVVEGAASLTTLADLHNALSDSTQVGGVAIHIGGPLPFPTRPVVEISSEGFSSSVGSVYVLIVLIICAICLVWGCLARVLASYRVFTEMRSGKRVTRHQRMLPLPVSVLKREQAHAVSLRSKTGKRGKADSKSHRDNFGGSATDDDDDPDAPLMAAEDVVCDFAQWETAASHPDALPPAVKIDGIRRSALQQPLRRGAAAFSPPRKRYFDDSESSGDAYPPLHDHNHSHNTPPRGGSRGRAEEGSGGSPVYVNPVVDVETLTAGVFSPAPIPRQLRGVAEADGVQPRASVVVRTAGLSPGSPAESPKDRAHTPPPHGTLCPRWCAARYVAGERLHDEAESEGVEEGCAPSLYAGAVTPRAPLPPVLPIEAPWLLASTMIGNSAPTPASRGPPSPLAVTGGVPRPLAASTEGRSSFTRGGLSRRRGAHRGRLFGAEAAALRNSVEEWVTSAGEGGGERPVTGGGDAVAAVAVGGGVVRDPAGLVGGGMPTPPRGGAGGGYDCWAESVTGRRASTAARPVTPPPRERRGVVGGGRGDAEGAERRGGSRSVRRRDGGDTHPVDSSGGVEGVVEGEGPRRGSSFPEGEWGGDGERSFADASRGVGVAAPRGGAGEGEERAAQFPIPTVASDGGVSSSTPTRRSSQSGMGAGAVGALRTLTLAGGASQAASSIHQRSAAASTVASSATAAGVVESSLRPFRRPTSSVATGTAPSTSHATPTTTAPSAMMRVPGGGGGSGGGGGVAFGEVEATQGASSGRAGAGGVDVGDGGAFAIGDFRECVAGGGGGGGGDSAGLGSGDFSLFSGRGVSPGGGEGGAAAAAVGPREVLEDDDETDDVGSGGGGGGERSGGGECALGHSAGGGEVMSVASAVKEVGRGMTDVTILERKHTPAEFGQKGSGGVAAEVKPAQVGVEVGRTAALLMRNPPVGLRGSSLHPAGVGGRGGEAGGAVEESAGGGGPTLQPPAKRINARPLLGAARQRQREDEEEGGEGGSDSAAHPLSHSALASPLPVHTGASRPRHPPSASASGSGGSPAGGVSVSTVTPVSPTPQPARGATGSTLPTVRSRLSAASFSPSGRSGAQSSPSRTPLVSEARKGETAAPSLSPQSPSPAARSRAAAAAGAGGRGGVAAVRRSCTLSSASSSSSSGSSTSVPSPPHPRLSEEPSASLSPTPPFAPLAPNSSSPTMPLASLSGGSSTRKAVGVQKIATRGQPAAVTQRPASPLRPPTGGGAALGGSSGARTSGGRVNGVAVAVAQGEGVREGEGDRVGGGAAAPKLGLIKAMMAKKGSAGGAMRSGGGERAAAAVREDSRPRERALGTRGAAVGTRVVEDDDCDGNDGVSESAPRVSPPSRRLGVGGVGGMRGSIGGVREGGNAIPRRGGVLRAGATSLAAVVGVEDAHSAVEDVREGVDSGRGRDASAAQAWSPGSGKVSVGMAQPHSPRTTSPAGPRWRSRGFSQRAARGAKVVDDDDSSGDGDDL